MKGHTYWLYKGDDDDVVRLYDLTVLCDAPSRSGNSTTDTLPPKNPFAHPVAMLLYRIALRLTQEKTGDRDNHAIRSLLMNALQLMDKESHRDIATSAALLLAGLPASGVGAPLSSGSMCSSISPLPSGSVNKSGNRAAGCKPAPTKPKSSSSTVLTGVASTAKVIAAASAAAAAAESSGLGGDAVINPPYMQLEKMVAMTYTCALRELAAAVALLGKPAQPLMQQVTSAYAKLAQLCLKDGHYGRAGRYAVLGIHAGQYVGSPGLDLRQPIPAEDPQTTLWQLSESLADALTQISSLSRETFLSHWRALSERDQNDGIFAHTVLMSHAAISKRANSTLKKVPTAGAWLEKWQAGGTRFSLHLFIVGSDDDAAVKVCQALTANPTEPLPFTTTLSYAVDLYSQLLKPHPAKHGRDHIFLVTKKLGNAYNALGIEHLKQFLAAGAANLTSWGDARHALHRALCAFESIGDQPNVSLVNLNLGKLMHARQWLDEALQYFDAAARALHKRHHNPDVWDAVNLELASAYLAAGISMQEAATEPKLTMDLLRKAIAHFELEKKVAAEIDHKDRLARSLERIGGLHHRLARLNVALYQAPQTGNKEAVAKLAELHFQRALKHKILSEHASTAVESKERVQLRLEEAEFLTLVGGGLSQNSRALGNLTALAGDLALCYAAAAATTSDYQRDLAAMIMGIERVAAKNLLAACRLTNAPTASSKQRALQARLKTMYGKLLAIKALPSADAQLDELHRVLADLPGLFASLCSKSN